MNYELKSVAPLSVLINAVRFFVVVGFLVAVWHFFISGDPSIHFNSVGQRLMGTVLFTVVYGVAVAVTLTLGALLYNLWASRFKGVTFRLEQK
jgi:hypothetical protein